jgi:hypothetical protein
LSRWIASGFVLLASAVSAQAPVTVAGEWHGVLQSPIGPLTLIITNASGERGTLRGNMESPDQGAPKIPFTTVAVTDGRLS